MPSDEEAQRRIVQLDCNEKHRKLIVMIIILLIILIIFLPMEALRDVLATAGTVFNASG
jgi:accessory gene regulator protein AgrB